MESFDDNKNIINLIIDSWRFVKLFEKVISKLDAGEKQRYFNQVHYYLNSLNNCLEKFEMKIVNLEGQKFDPGMAVTPINLEDFDPNLTLIIEQMIEPVIMGKTGIVNSGTVLLREAKV